MSDHPKTLRFFADGDANHFTILDDDNHWVLSLLHNGEATTQTQIKNLRRMVACWNACDGVSTDALETVGQSLLDGETAALSEQCDALREALLAFRSASGGSFQGWHEKYADAIALADAALATGGDA